MKCVRCGKDCVHRFSMTGTSGLSGWWCEKCQGWQRGVEGYGSCNTIYSEEELEKIDNQISLSEALIVKPELRMPVAVVIGKCITPAGKLKRVSFPGNVNKVYVDEENRIFEVWYDRENRTHIFYYTASIYGGQA